MNQLDQQLIAELRVNGRTSVPKSAQILNVACGPVQSRLDRLIGTGVTRGFTVRLRVGADDSLIQRVILERVRGAPHRGAPGLPAGPIRQLGWPVAARFAAR